MTATPRRFPPPWSVEELDACFVVRDHNGQALAYVYFEDEPGRRSAAKLLSKDEARRIASNIAKLTELPRSSTPTPGSDGARHDRQSNPTGGGSYHLADDRDDVEAIQGWDQELEDFCANNSAYSSRNRISGGT
jgi:hypothetical protein